MKSLSLDFRSFGLESQTYGRIKAMAKGIDVSAMFDYGDGLVVTAMHRADFAEVVIDAINRAGNTPMLTVSRDNTGDSMAFD